MNRRSFIARCASAVAAVLFPWRVGRVKELQAASAAVAYAKIASKFQWECTYLPLGIDRETIRPLYLINCWGRFQDGKDYQCAEYVDLESEYFKGEYSEGVWETTDPEEMLHEIALTTNQAMRRRFDRIENDRTESS